MKHGGNTGESQCGLVPSVRKLLSVVRCHGCSGNIQWNRASNQKISNCQTDQQEMRTFAKLSFQKCCDGKRISNYDKKTHYGKASRPEGVPLVKVHSWLNCENSAKNPNENNINYPQFAFLVFTSHQFFFHTLFSAYFGAVLDRPSSYSGNHLPVF